MTVKEQKKQLIEETPLFGLPKGSSGYKTERYKLINNVFEYLYALDDERVGRDRSGGWYYREYSEEIFRTVERCIDNYCPDSGSPFLNYLRSAIKTELTRAMAKEYNNEQRGGIHMAEADARDIRRIRKYLKSKGIEEPTDIDVENIAVLIGIPKERVVKLIITDSETRTLRETVRTDDGDSLSLIELQSDGETPESILEGKERLIALLGSIEGGYKELQERTKPIIGKLMTARVCAEICTLRIDVSEYSFVDRGVMTEYITSGSVPTQRDIADELGRNEASISRTLNEFLGKLRT